MKPPPIPLCCDALWKAMQNGSDSEGYGPAIQGGSSWEVAPHTEWKMGEGLPPLAFCPWCGSRLRDLTEEVVKELERVIEENPE